MLASREKRWKQRKLMIESRASVKGLGWLRKGGRGDTGTRKKKLA